MGEYLMCGGICVIFLSDIPWSSLPALPYGESGVVHCPDGIYWYEK